ncbi:transcriptional regulator BetI [Paenibacillus konkukensis]|uniref:Transcriptional regulator BetI n=1 Tax=Paenibacillus konkukensis TaxID=2020716 RepID=A0ABY4RHF6_9BACL|nr:TetR/AcrR family transcriptional regulator [Paenibacillus konkukensis]UQZ81059.1 transcriptional regulator BetI [Paenibacillus konkukensis]
MSNNMFNEFLSSESVKLTVKQQRIVQAAIRLFAEKGYSNTSTAEIAKLAEVSEASIFKQYGTKDKLLLALIIPQFKEFFPSMADEVLGQLSRSQSTFEGFLREFLRNRIELALKNKEIFQIIIKELIYKEELKKELIPYIFEVAASRLTQVIELFKERGELTDIPTGKMLKSLFTFVGGFFASQFVLLNKESIDEQEIEDAVRFMLHGIGSSSSNN